EAVSFAGNLLVLRDPTPDRRRRLAWYDRSGRSIGEVAVPDNAQGVEIAPNASRVAFEVFEKDSASRDLWVATLETGQTQKVAFTDADEADPKWMPDSRTIVFGLTRVEVSSIAKLVLDSTDAVRPLEGFEMDNASQYPSSLSHDGNVVTFMRSGVPF